MQNDRKVLYMENTFGYADSGSPGTFSIPSSPFMRSRLGTPAIDSNLWHGLPIQTGDALGDAIGTINQNSNWRQSPTPTREVQTPYHYHDVQLSETDEALLPNDDTNDPSLSRTKAIHEGGSNSDITLCSPARGDSENYFSGREQEAELEELDLSSRRYKKRKTSIQNVSTQRQGRIDEPLFASDINREPLSSQSVSSTRDENMRMRSHLATEGSVESTFPSDNTLIGGRYRVVVVQSLKDGRFYDPRDLDDGALILGTDEKSTTGGSSASMLLAAMASSGEHGYMVSTVVLIRISRRISIQPTGVRYAATTTASRNRRPRGTNSAA
ncbi:hypothetical protein CPB83DRAFT_849213 [Crepidotus variabilis]|uniref:Uncharacterized protein n=1 Tax=Crepidotus variabilis TaxID=179855 RepID=A0A9P6JS39_9AGAR|nr:hypothetical protein CPB83DRAFT_849213 [Crepidotus variabilis]